MSGKLFREPKKIYFNWNLCPSLRPATAGFLETKSWLLLKLADQGLVLSKHLLWLSSDSFDHVLLSVLFAFKVLQIMYTYPSDSLTFWKGLLKVLVQYWPFLCFSALNFSGAQAFLSCCHWIFLKLSVNIYTYVLILASSISRDEGFLEPALAGKPDGIVILKNSHNFLLQDCLIPIWNPFPVLARSCWHTACLPVSRTKPTIC